MTLAPQPSPNDQNAHRDWSWSQRLTLLLLIMIGSFGCMLLAAQFALLRLKAEPLERDVRSVVEVDYGAGERRAAPLVPEVVDAVRQDLEAALPTPDPRVVTVVPVVEIPPTTPTALALITPTPSATATPRPSPTGVVVPSDTPIPSATATAAPPPTDTAMPTVRPTATFSPVPPTQTSVPTQTPPPSTVTPTSTAPPTPTETSIPPTRTPTSPPPPPPITSTPTGTSPPTSTDTPTPSDTPTATSTPTATPTFTPVPPPLVLAIIPNEIVEGSSIQDIDVTIIGERFFGSVARLGQGIWIRVLSVAETIITGTLSPSIPAGIYALTVENADGQQGVLQRAFTVRPDLSPTRTLDSDVAFVATFGPAALPSEGDDDFVQILFLEVLDGPNDPLYIRIFDADTGGAHDKAGLDGSFGDTMMTYSLRGGSGAYTEPDARSDHPGTAGIISGVPITQQTIGVDGARDNQWWTLPVTRNQGELVGGSRIFKLVVQGDAGDDGNWYQVSISTDPSANIAVPGARVFAFSWCVALPGPGDQVNLYPFVPVNANTVTQFNFDYDVSPGSSITLTTPLRNLPVVGLSGNGATASQGFTPFTGEKATTWTAHYVLGSLPLVKDQFTLWFRGDGFSALAVFTEPALVPPP